MTPPGPAPLTATPEHADEATGLPGLRTWRAVYLLVFGAFLLWVLLLSVLTVIYS